MSSEFGKDHGLVHEAIVTGRKVGAGEEFWAVLAHREAIFARVVAFVAELVRVVFRLIAIERDMTGWELLEPSPAEDGDFEPTIHKFLTDEDKGRCGGEEMIKRAGKKGISSGLRHLEAMLREQEKIPVERRKYVLVSTEVWRGPDGGRCVWCLVWGGERWYLYCSRLEGVFSSFCRLVGSRASNFRRPLDA